MSGIAGILALDGTTPAAVDIDLLTARLERRGPDGTAVWTDDSVTFGHTLLATTAEALAERLPFTDEASGCTITADARIDNRDDLLRMFDLTGEKRTVGDGELILRAYLEWGEDCASRLLGDFAFAIWDARSARLLCARDQIGMRPLIYHHEPGRRFVFASEVLAVRALPGMNAPLNHDRVGDFLSNMEGADLESTFFEHIHRLPPAHVLTVDEGGMAVRRYWELAPEPELDLPSDDAYAAAFREVFAKAVECRLRNAGSIGAMLSGGIDSNAVAAVAASLLGKDETDPLPTFSAIGPDPVSCPETKAIATAARSPRFRPTMVDYSALGPLEADLSRDTHESDEPFDADMVMIRSIYRSAQRAGIKVVLDGAAGDTVLESNFHNAFLLREGKLGQFLREVRGERRFWGPGASIARSALASMWQAFAPMPVRTLRFWRGRRQADRTFVERAAAEAPFLTLPRALARRRGVQRRDVGNDRIDARTRLRSLTHPNIVVGRERYDRLAAACGVEPRDPFLDLRVIRFCLSLPLHQLYRDGWPKWVLRRAMSGAVPDAITWRRGKEHIGTEFSRAIVYDPSYSPTARTPDALERLLTQRYENIYLSNWIAYMVGAGWISGPVNREGRNDDHR